MKKNIKKLKEQFENCCNEYVKLFCEKQDVVFDGWVGDEIGGIASFAEQYFFNLSEIILDINKEVTVGLILNWQSEGVEYNTGLDFPVNINYSSYIKGMRYETT